MLDQELHNPVIKKIGRTKLYSRFNGNIWAACLPEMRSLSSKNGGAKYLLCAIDVFTKYARAKSSADKKCKIVLDGFMSRDNKSASWNDNLNLDV